MTVFMEVRLDYKITDIGWELKKVVRENKLKTVYLNFTQNKK